MNTILGSVAAVAAEPAGKTGQGGGFFDVLGIDWQLLVIQTIAFLILLWLLSRYVYPPLNRMLEKREADIEASVRGVKEAETRIDKTKEDVAKILHDARKEAAELVGMAREEAKTTVEAAEGRARGQAERIVADAEVRIAKEVAAAKQELHDQTVELVAQATGKMLGHVVTPDIDKKLIRSILKESK